MKLIPRYECITLFAKGFVCKTANFPGNEAAVFILKYWPEENILLDISLSSCVHEVTFAVILDSERLEIRWFNGRKEVPMCGHGALALAHVLADECTDQLVREVLKIKYPLQLSGRSVLFKKGTFSAYNKPVSHKQWQTARDHVIQVDSLERLANFTAKDMNDVKGKMTCIIAYYDKKETIHFRLFVTLGKIVEDAVSISAIPVLYDLLFEQFHSAHIIFRQESFGGYFYSVQYIGDQIGVSGEFIVTAREGSVKG